MKDDAGLSITIRDDRGNTVTVTGSANNELDILKSSLRGGEIYKESMRTTWTNAGWLVVGCAAALAAGYALRIMIPGYARTFWALPLCLMVAFVIGRVTWKNSARRRVLQRKVREMVERGACPACDYGLREIPTAADGCTVCPECGAAWRMRRGKDGSA